METKHNSLVSHAAPIGLEHADYCVDNQKTTPVDQAINECVAEGIVDILKNNPNKK